MNSAVKYVLLVQVLKDALLVSMKISIWMRMEIASVRMGIMDLEMSVGFVMRAVRLVIGTLSMTV